MCSSWNRIIGGLPKNDFCMVNGSFSTFSCHMFSFLVVWFDFCYFCCLSNIDRTPELSDWKFLSFFFCKLQAEEGFYFVGKDLSSILKQKFYQLVGEHRAVPQEVEVVMGRTLQVCLQSQYFLGWWYFNLCLFYYNLPGSNGW